VRGILPELMAEAGFRDVSERHRLRTPLGTIARSRTALSYDGRVATALETLIKKWRDDPGGTYRSWFLWEERIKNFRSIRRGIMQVIEEIESGAFGVAYRGSSLETVLDSIAEQRQIFKGADHAFMWKPKLRIPDRIGIGDDQLLGLAIEVGEE
jgi:hypothetical protein